MQASIIKEAHSPPLTSLTMTSERAPLSLRIAAFLFVIEGVLELVLNASIYLHNAAPELIFWTRKSGNGYRQRVGRPSVNRDRDRNSISTTSLADDRRVGNRVRMWVLFSSSPYGALAHGTNLLGFSVTCFDSYFNALGLAVLGNHKSS